MSSGRPSVPRPASPLRAEVVVLGSGIAGLSLALKAARLGRDVLLLTKKDSAESNTNYAQGGIASVMDAADDLELHVQDTLVAGDGLCDEGVVWAIVTEGPDRVRELAELGVDFAREAGGGFELGREGGHSRRRILHVKDMTGRAIEQALIAAVAGHPQVRVLEHHLAIDLVTERKATDPRGPGRVIGLYALDVHAGVVVAVRSDAVVLATGGAGQVYPYTTNPSIATGDGIAMAWRAGAEVRNMEFMQFHPTALWSSTGERFLISEAVRGEGAVLRDASGRAFMGDHDPRGDLAPRDIVARAIDQEMKRTGARHVWLDITGRSEGEVARRFPTIAEACRRAGYDLGTQPVPVVPAAHYLCGGVKTDLDGRSSIPGLYACGEAASTGLHGANRLASNSLLEAVVVAHRAAGAIDAQLGGLANGEDPPIPPWVDGWVQEPDERVVLVHNLDELRQLMWDYVGIVRTDKRLERAAARLELLAREIREYYWNFVVEPRLLELRNLVDVAELVVASARSRKESRGLHHTLDHPGKLPEARDTVLRRS